MDLWINILNLVLIGVSVSSVLWALRQQAVLQRVFAGLQSLRQGKKPERLQREGEESEPILREFDLFVDMLQQSGRIAAPAENGQKSRWRSVLGQVATALRPSLVTIQSHLALLAQEGDAEFVQVQKEYLRQVQAQVDALLRLLDSPATMSELRHGLSGVQRRIAAQTPASAGTILLVDADANAAAQLAESIVRSGRKVLVAPDAEAAAAMAFAATPSLILVNAVSGGGTGWRSLPGVLRTVDVEDVRVCLYSLDDSAGRLWTPRAIWLWPASDLLDLLAASWQSHPHSVRILGDQSLALELTSSLAEIAVDATPAEDAIAPTLPHCCTLVFDAEVDQSQDYVLVVPAERIETSAGILADDFARSAGENSTSVDSIVNTVLAAK